MNRILFVMTCTAVIAMLTVGTAAESTSPNSENFWGHFENMPEAPVRFNALLFGDMIYLHQVDSEGRESSLTWSETGQIYELTWKDEVVSDLTTYQDDQGFYHFEGMYTGGTPEISGYVTTSSRGENSVNMNIPDDAPKLYTTDSGGNVLDELDCVCSSLPQFFCASFTDCHRARACIGGGICIFITSTP